MRLTRAWLLLLTGAASLPLAAADASHLYKLGLKAERGGAIARAYLYYAEAAAQDPRRAIYRERAEALAPMAAMAAQVKPPGFENDPVTDEARHIDLSPEAVFDSITARELALQPDLLPAARLDLKSARASFDYNGDYKALFAQLAGALGLQVVFDGDYQPGRQLSFRLNDATPREALHGLEAITNSFVVPVGPKVFLVAQDTDAKRRDLEQTETVTIPVPQVLTIQEITELGQAVKQSVGVDKIYWDAQANQMILKDRVSRVMAAQTVLNDLIAYRGQVAIDLQFVELDDTKMQELGVDLQTSFPINFIAAMAAGNTSGAASAVASALTISQLAKLGFTHMFGVGVANVNVIAKMTSAGSRTLLRTTVVSNSGQKATFHAGTKYPIITSQFVGGVSTGGQVFMPTPSFTFEDLGIVVNVTPHVHGMDETSMEVDTEFKVLGADSGNGIPIISNRKVMSTLRLRNDQWALVAGLTEDTTSRAVRGPAFLSRLPLLGNLISHWTRSRATTYVILAMRPRLMSVPPEERVTHAVYVGSETRTATPL